MGRCVRSRARGTARAAFADRCRRERYRIFVQSGFSAGARRAARRHRFRWAAVAPWVLGARTTWEPAQEHSSAGDGHGYYSGLNLPETRARLRTQVTPVPRNAEL